MGGLSNWIRTAKGRIRPFRSQQCHDEPGFERGVILLEFALVTPIIVMMAFSLVEFGSYFRDRMLLDGVAREAAVFSSKPAAGAFSDYAVIEALRGIASATNNPGKVLPGPVTRLIIYKADPAVYPNGDVPPACLAQFSQGGVGNICNIYTDTQLKTLASLGGGSTSAEVDGVGGFSRCGSCWNPTSRVAGDHLGVYIEVTHSWTLPTVQQFTGPTTVMNDRFIVILQ